MNNYEIIEVMNRWKSAFSKNKTEEICALYEDQAGLWGTLSPTRRDSHELIKDYFERIFQYVSRRVEFEDFQIRVFDNMAISSGIYKFYWVENAVKVTIKARFSFIYLNKAGRWLIIEHHSSTLPKTL